MSASKTDPRHHPEISPAINQLYAALSTLALSGAAIELVGQASTGGITYALAMSHASSSPDAAQALNVLAGGLILVPLPASSSSALLSPPPSLPRSSL